jgi:GNAT superfamily N-acetyltransferase
VNWYGLAFADIERRSMEVRLEVDTDPSDELRAAILGPLTAFNAANGYPPDARPLAIVLRDEDRIVGGLWSKTGYDWLFVEFLVVDEGARGRNFGARLMKAAEELAVQRGCVGAWLTTFPFQARGFYEKLGYSVFAELDNSPADNVRLFMRKRLAQKSCRSAGDGP